MKYLLMNQGYYPQLGGVENSLRHIAKELTKLGHKVHVLTSNRTNDGQYLSTTEQTAEATIYRYRKVKGCTYLNGFLLFILLIAKNRYDLIICRSYILSIYCVITRRKYIYISPASVELQDKPTNDLLLRRITYKIKVMLQETTYKYASEIFVFSENMKKHVSALSTHYQVRKIRPGCDKSRFSSVSNFISDSNNNDHPNNKKTILCIGRLNNVKGFDDAIKIFCEFHNQLDSELIIVGSGPDENKLKELVRTLNIKDAVKFVGSVPNPEIYFTNASCFLFTSYYEPYGQVLLEAATAQVPIVCFRRDPKVPEMTATTEIFEDFPDAVTFCDTYVEACNALLTQCENPEYLKNSDYQHFTRLHSWERFTQEVCGLLR